MHVDRQARLIWTQPAWAVLVDLRSAFCSLVKSRLFASLGMAALQRPRPRSTGFIYPGSVVLGPRFVDIVQELSA